MRNPPAFNDYERGPDFDRARTQIATPFQYLDIALDTAITDQQYNISGDFLYIDTRFDGEATIELNNQQNAPVAPFYVQPGFALNALFKSIKLSATAQPGKKIRIMYSTGERVVPALSGTLAVTGTVSTREEATVYGSAYDSTSTLGAAAPETIISPAANTGGATLWMADYNQYHGGASALFGLVIKTSAPVSLTDGDVVPMRSSIGTAGNWSSKSLLRPIEIAAGRGLYAISTTAETGALRSAFYTLN